MNIKKYFNYALFSVVLLGAFASPNAVYAAKGGLGGVVVQALTDSFRSLLYDAEASRLLSTPKDHFDAFIKKHSVSENVRECLYSALRCSEDLESNEKFTPIKSGKIYSVSLPCGNYIIKYESLPSLLERIIQKERCEQIILDNELSRICIPEKKLCQLESGELVLVCKYVGETLMKKQKVREGRTKAFILGCYSGKLNDQFLKFLEFAEYADWHPDNFVLNALKKDPPVKRVNRIFCIDTEFKSFRFYGDPEREDLQYFADCKDGICRKQVLEHARFMTKEG